MSHNIFGTHVLQRADASACSALEPFVTVKATPGFLQRYPHAAPSATEFLAIPVKHWVDAMHDGYAPKLLPMSSCYQILHHVPLQVLSRYFVQ